MTLQDDSQIKDIVQRLDMKLMRILVEMDDHKMYHPNLSRRVETISKKLTPQERGHLESSLSELIRKGLVQRKPRPTPNFIYGLTISGGKAALYAREVIVRSERLESLKCRQWIWEHFDTETKKLVYRILERKESDIEDRLSPDENPPPYKVEVTASFYCYECTQDHIFVLLAGADFQNEYTVVGCRNAPYGWKIHNSLMKRPFKRWNDWT